MRLTLENHKEFTKKKISYEDFQRCQVKWIATVTTKLKECWNNDVEFPQLKSNK